MIFAYPCLLTPDEDGWLTATFPDIPEAGTDGKTRDESLTLAADAVAVALAGYVHAKRDIPAPSPLQDGQVLVPLPPIVAAKLSLYTAMRAQGVTKVDLAKRLGLSESAVRKIADPDHRSHIAQVERALKCLGRTLIMTDQPSTTEAA